MRGAPHLSTDADTRNVSTARAITESPLDFIKVRKQTGQGWTAAATPAQALRQPLTELRHLYTGFGLTWAR